MITTLSTDFADLVAEFISQEQDLAAANKLLDPGVALLSFKDNSLPAYSELADAFPSAANYFTGEYEIVSIGRHSAVTGIETINSVTNFKLLIIPVHNWEGVLAVEYDASPNAKLTNYTVPEEYPVTVGYYRKSSCVVQDEHEITGPFIVDAGTAWSLKVTSETTEPAVFISCALVQL